MSDNMFPLQKDFKYNYQYRNKYAFELIVVLIHNVTYYLFTMMMDIHVMRILFWSNF